MDDTEIMTALANAKTPEKALAFATNWGLPDQPYRLHSAGGIELDRFFAFAQELTRAMDATPAAVRKQLASRPTPKDPEIYKIFCDLYGEDGADQKFGLEEPTLGNLRLAMDKKNRFVLRPHSLMQFCRMQAVETDFSSCLGCGSYLPHNPKGGRPKDYCNNACKQRQWRKRQRINH